MDSETEIPANQSDDDPTAAQNDPATTFASICMCGQCGYTGKLRSFRRGKLGLGRREGGGPFPGQVAGIIEVDTGFRDLPLQAICQKARAQQSETDRYQILVILEAEQRKPAHPTQLCRSARLSGSDGEGASLHHKPSSQSGPNAQQTSDIDPQGSDHQERRGKVLHWVSDVSRPSTADITFVEVCQLAYLGHPDILHALTSGFDQLWIQQADSGRGERVQTQELALVSALGGSDCVFLFQTLQEVRAGLGRPATARFRIQAEFSETSSRWDIVRACALALLPTGTTRVPLPNQSPYGTLAIQNQGCDFCQACSWVCPTGAITMAVDGCSLNFTESDCVQCGLCISVCHRRSLNLVPSLNLDASARQPATLILSKPGQAGAKKWNRTLPFVGG